MSATAITVNDMTKLVVGKNDLATTHPELVAQLVDTDPTTVSYGSNKEVDWRCAQGHLYQMMIKVRVRGSKSPCTVCSGKRVVPGDNDMATTHPELAAELVDTDPTTVVAGTNQTLWWKCSLRHHWSALGSSRVRGDGCPYCSNKRVLPWFNDMATTRPDLAAELLDTDPRTILAGTGTWLMWQCSKAHRFRQTGNHRLWGKGCRYCARKAVVPGETDLATTHSALAAQLVDTDPTTILSGDSKPRQWRCDKCQWEWLASANNRTSRGSGCPSCNTGGFDPSKPSFLYLMERDGEQQVGITGDIDRRTSQHLRGGWMKIVDVEGQMSGRLAAELEKQIIGHLKAEAVTLPRSREAWSTKELKVESIAELIRRSRPVRKQ